MTTRRSFLKQTAGTISLFGDSNQNAESRRKIIYLPERFQPSPQLSGWEYLSILTAYFSQAVDRDEARRAMVENRLQLMMAQVLSSDGPFSDLDALSEAINQRRQLEG